MIAVATATAVPENAPSADCRVTFRRAAVAENGSLVILFVV